MSTPLTLKQRLMDHARGDLDPLPSGEFKNPLAKDAVDEIERLERGSLANEAQCAAMRGALEWCGGMEHLATGNQISEMSPVKEALSPDAGRKVLDVMRAAQEVADTSCESGLATLRDALSALGWKP